MEELEVAALIQEDTDACRACRFMSIKGERTLDAAYGLQRAYRSVRIARGERHIGYKIGCTGAAIRQKLGINEAVHGDLWDREQLPDGSKLLAGSYRSLGIEGELCVHLVDTSGPVENWVVDYEPVIELHHYCFDGIPQERAYELVSRNCIHAGNDTSPSKSPCA